uniref:Uncharacterized protein n=1 Tax=Romanomermis culicivorax TaxID=13658 RepID=A0A915J9J6_ROMCU
MTERLKTDELTKINEDYIFNRLKNILTGRHAFINCEAKYIWLATLCRCLKSLPSLPAALGPNLDDISNKHKSGKERIP